jgi:hypothetical protein
LIRTHNGVNDSRAIYIALCYLIETGKPGPADDIQLRCGVETFSAESANEFGSEEDGEEDGAASA